MFKLLKKIVGRGEKKKEEIPFSHVQVWFESKIRETTLTKDLSDFFNRFSQMTLVFDKQLHEAAKKEFSTDQDQAEIIHEHLSTYIGALQTFLKQIEHPEKKDAESIVLYEETVSAALANIKQNAQSMIKLYARFHPEEAEEFSETFDSFSELQEELHELVKQEQGVFFVYSVQKLIKEIQKKKKHVIELELNIQKEDLKQQEAEAYRLKLETNLDDLKTSPEYEKYDGLVSRKIKVEKELERENQNMTLLFSPIASLFAQYAQQGLGADQALARQYAENPLVTLHNDAQLFVVDLLKHVSEKLHELEPDERKRLRARQSLLGLTQEALQMHRAQYDRLKQLQGESQRQLVLNTTTIKIEDLKYKLAHVNEQIRLLAENKEKHDTAITQINVDKDIQALQRQLQSLGGVTIV